ncbi:zinc-binding alcohol dehydrogenase family protein [Alloacidobacterium dinghuense]|uniref:Zinc-type alcohol dehydrogenase-like protein n=1 Tax=Alloacidobacterium dinghuense TaxID=2763107 RepID=A0A7G8BGJ5_9BACT|nr:zinc-binding alcohol dehydrogenase family protein [Alloacidobacterium dinghuense]QNI31665.1 zinc-binding alcohol dehydrogenase family protein [Alloacidobacterium dinghuense]
MKGVGYKKPLPISNLDSLIDIEVPVPTPSGRDLLVRIEAVSVNPADTKLRAGVGPLPGDEFRILGFDGAGVVIDTGEDVELFKKGDEVWYAGSVVRPGTNAEYHLVDERIVGLKPRTLDFTQAAALPLTAITAWELLVDRFGLRGKSSGHGDSILIIGGAGGVGSILTQLARKLTGLNVITTASRPETSAWCIELGAHFVIDHTKRLKPQLESIRFPTVNYIAALTASDCHYPGMIEVLAPEGTIGMIDDPPHVDVKPLKDKSASFHWEFMFARPKYQTQSMIRQHELLSSVAKMVDNGELRTTIGENVGVINASNLKKAHTMLESGRTRGKIVLTGF